MVSVFKILFLSVLYAVYIGLSTEFGQWTTNSCIRRWHEYGDPFNLQFLVIHESIIFMYHAKRLSN